MSIHKLFIFIVTGLCLFLVYTNLDAQNQVTISGAVSDESGEVSPFTPVVEIKSKIGVQTDESGKYKLVVPRADTLYLEFRSGMYPTVKKTIISPASDITLDIVFQSEGFTLGVVTVTEQFKQKEEENTVSLASIEPKRIDRMANVSLVNAMQNVPGVTVYDNQPSIRGSSGYTYGAGSRVLTLLNGLPMFAADKGSVTWDMLPTDNIRQIEVFKGASSVLYGAGAMGGVINVITQEAADTPRTVIRVKSGFYDRPANPRADWDPSFLRGFNASTHLIHSRQFKKNYDLTLQLDLINNNGYRKYEVNRRGRIFILNKYRFQGKLKGLVVGFNGMFNYDSTATIVAWGGYPDSALIPGPGFLSKQLKQYGGIDPYISYTGKNSQHLYQSRWYIQSYGISTGQSGTASISFHEYQYKRSFLNERLNLIGGLSYMYSRVNSDSAFGQGTGNQLAAFAQLKFKLNTRTNFILGVRYQYEDVSGDTVKVNTEKGTKPLLKKTTMKDPIFRAGINYRPTQSTYVRASFGQALRSPSIAERFTATFAGPIQVTPNPDINIEKGWSAELGVRQLYKFGNTGGFIDASLFTMQFNNMVEFWVDTRDLLNTLMKSNRYPFKAMNISRASVTGAEVNFNYNTKFAKNWEILLVGGCTFVEPTDKTGDATLNTDQSWKDGTFIRRLIEAATPPYIPFQDRPSILKYRNKWLIKTNLDISYKRFTFATNYTYNSQMINVDKVFLLALSGVGDFREKHNKGWHIFDFIVSYRVNGRSTISAHVFNAFNTEYITIPGYMGEQRNFTAQYKIQF